LEMWREGLLGIKKDVSGNEIRRQTKEGEKKNNMRKKNSQKHLLGNKEKKGRLKR